MKKLISIAALLALAACGGGSEDATGSAEAADADDPDAPARDAQALAAKTYAVGEAWSRFLRKGGTWSTKSRDSDGRRYDVRFSMTPDPEPWTYAGREVARSDFTISVDYRGDTLLSSGSALFFDRGSKRIATIEGADGSCSNVNSSRAVPATAKMNASGSLYRATVYSNCPYYNVGNTSATWSLVTRNGYPLMCMNVTTRTTGTLFESYCVQISTTGKLGKRASVTVRSGDFSVTPLN